MVSEDVVIGLNIRKEPSGHSTKLGLLPRGAKVTIGERSKDGRWGRIKQILSGQVKPVELGGIVAQGGANGWLFLGELDQAPAEPEAYDNVVVPATPVPIRAGERIGYMGEYQHYHDRLPTPRRALRPLLHLEVFSTDDVPAFIAASREYARSLPAGSGSLLVIDKGAKLVMPSQPSLSLDPAQMLVEASDSPAVGPWVKVRRGQLHVHPRASLGTYSSATNRYANGAKWTGWYVGYNSTQRTRDKALANKLRYGRREVLVPYGDPLWVERTALAGGAARVPAWHRFPLQLAHQADPASEFTRVLTREELERAAAEQRAIDAEGNKWWLLTLRRPAGSASSAQALQGWACEKGHAKIAWQSPWAWPGFALVEEGGLEPADMYANALELDGSATADESVDFKARADKVDRSALVQTLYQQIDRNGNGRFDPEELRAAAQQPLLAQALSRLIAKYESEWGGDEAKWNALDPLMLEGKSEWSAEKGRIKRLQWWSAVSAKLGATSFPADSQAYHFHPIGLIGNFQLAARDEERPESADDGAPIEPSGRKWVSRFLSSSKVTDLKQPFQGNAASFIAALEAAGVTVTINTTWRPPQRSYLMYYAREVSRGRLAPDKVPKFQPKNGDKPVNIDWAHRDGKGKADLVKARKAAAAMDAAYAAAGAIGKPYQSNHNGANAIDMRLTPAWGIGKTVVDANGKSRKVASKRDIIDVGATYKVLHWNYAGAKKKVDDPHWSATGN